MKRILILIIGLFGVAQAQYQATSAKTKFVNGLSIGSKDSTYFTNAGDTVVIYFGRDSSLYARFKGYHKRIAYANGTDFVPYSGAVTNVNLGAYRLTARSIKTDSIYANSSAGMYLTTNTGTAVAHWGGGGSVEVDFKGFAGYDANRSASYTARSFTDKGYVDSADGLRVRYSDTAAMLSNYRRTTTKITNSDLVNSTISGVSLGGTLFNHSNGYGLSGSAYNGSAAQTWLVDTSVISTKANVTGSLVAKLNISDTATMLSNYRRTTTKITNSDLVNSTISGVALGSNLNNLTAGNGLTGTAYNGGTAYTWTVDTATISTKANVTGLLTGYATTGSLSSYKPIADTFFTGGYTTRARTKQQIDSLSDAIGSGFVTVGTTQTVTGAKTFSAITNVSNTTASTSSATGALIVGGGIGVGTSGINGVRIHRGLANEANSVAIGTSSLTSTTSGLANQAFGISALVLTTTGSYNTAIGESALAFTRTGSNNTGLGRSAGSIGTKPITTGSNNTYIGYQAQSSDSTVSNETVIGASAIGNGSNTVTIGNSSVTNNYFTGNIRGGAFIKSGGTSSQFLKADGSVDGTAYQPALTLTTTGTSGAATLVGSTLNIPNYGAALSGYLPLTAGSGQPLSGMLTMSMGNNTQIFQSATATTGWQYWNMNNTSGQLQYGVESSTGGSLIAGSAAYSSYIGTNSGFTAPFYLVTNGIIRASVSSTAFGLTVPISGTSLSMSGIISNTDKIRANTNNANGTATIGTYFNNTDIAQFANNAQIASTTNYGFMQRNDGANFIGGTSLDINSPISGTSLSMSGGISGTTLTMSSSGSFGGALSGTTATFTGIGTFQGGNDGTALFLNRTGGIGVMAINVNSNNSWTMFDRVGDVYTAGITQQSGAVAIGTTTFDGTNKLIVNGGVKGTTGTFSGAVILDNNVYFRGKNTGGTGVNLIGMGGDNRIYVGDAGVASNVRIANSLGNMEISGSTGAATFSSSVTATGFVVSSDRSLKNIIKRDGDVAYYKWKDKQDDKVHIGYIAQEVQKTNPDQVSENNGKLAVNYIEILVEKVRALEKEIEQLKRKQK